MDRPSPVVMRVLSLLALLAVFVAGCDLVGGSEPEEELVEGSFMGLAAASTDDPDRPYVFTHQSGETMAVELDAADRLHRVALRDQAGLELVVTLGADGMPTTATVGEVVFVYANVRSDLADVVVITPGGESTVIRDVAVDADAARRARALAEARRAGQAPPSVGEVANAAGLGVGIVGCTITVVVGLGSIPVTGPIGATVAGGGAMGCAGAVVGVLTEYRNRHGTASAELEGTNAFFNAVGAAGAIADCTGSNPVACIEAALGLASGALSRNALTEAQVDQLIADARALLAGGGGDVQVSLTWNTTADLDLWVTDPAGERIYYGNRTSASGGQLDVDDRSGFGPENVFWPTNGAPAGTYTVQVDHYSGASPSAWRVTTVVAGRTQTFTGSVSTNQTDAVTTFTVGSARTVARVLPPRERGDAAK